MNNDVSCEFCANESVSCDTVPQYCEGIIGVQLMDPKNVIWHFGAGAVSAAAEGVKRGIAAEDGLNKPSSNGRPKIGEDGWELQPEFD